MAEYTIRALGKANVQIIPDAAPIKEKVAEAVIGAMRRRATSMDVAGSITRWKGMEAYLIMYTSIA